MLANSSAPPVGVLFVVSSPVTGFSGVVAKTTDGDPLAGSLQTLSGAQLAEIAGALKDSSVASVSISDVGSYRVMALPTNNGVIVVTGLPVTRSRTSSRSSSR